MTTILLVRHGQTDWNRDQRFQGHADPPLNERGREQARLLADAISGEQLDAIYSSPLRRALETARIVAARLALPVYAVDGLREIDVGEWQGLTRTQVEERFPDAFARWLAFGPGWTEGESYEQLGERVLAAVGEIAAAHREGGAVVVTHGGPIRAVLAHVDRVSHSEARRTRRVLDNCALARVVVHDGVLRLATDGSEESRGSSTNSEPAASPSGEPRRRRD